MDVLCNQLKSALLTVKIKAASLHYENVIGLVHSCGSDVGNMGHGRNQMKAMVQAFECYLHKISSVRLYHQQDCHHTLELRQTSLHQFTFQR